MSPGLPSRSGSFHLVTHYAFRHHGLFSSYNQVIDPLSRKLALTETVVRLPIERWDLVGQGSRAMAYARGRLHPWRCSHPHIHIHPEQTLGLLRSNVAQTVAIFHQPATRYETDKRQDMTAMRRGLGLVVSLGEVQTRQLRELGFNAVHIPHGVRSDIFFPPSSGRKERIAVFSRGWLRDESETLRAISTYEKRGWEVRVVGAGAPRISDADWRLLLQRSAVVKVAAPRAIGSNALLEAMASGCAIDGPLGVDALSYLTPRNRQIIAEGNVPDLDLDQLRAVGLENRLRVDSLFDWSVVAATLGTAVLRWSDQH